MTREEAIILIKSALKIMYLPKSKEYISDLGYALEIAIKALEQEPCNTDTRIEQIRAKVESINPWALAFASSEYKDTRPQIVARVKSHILEIIDKYKEDA